jgi:hypothetical protein
MLTRKTPFNDSKDESTTNTVLQNTNIPQSIEATKSNNGSDLNQDGKLETKELEYAYNIME